MKKLFTRLLNLKLRTKLFISYMLIIVLVAVANTIIFNIYEKNTVKVIEESSTGVIRQLADNISYKMSTFELNILYAADASKIFSDTDYNDYLTVKKNVNVFNMYIEGSGAVVTDDLFINNRNQTYYDRTSNGGSVSSINISNYVKNNTKKILADNGKAQYVTFEDVPGVIYIVKSNITFDTHVSNGIVAIGIRDEYLRNMFPSSIMEGSIVICDQNSKILIGETSANAVVDNFNKSGLSSIHGQDFFNYKGENLIIEKGISENYRWRAMYVVSLDELLKNINNIKEIVLVLLLVIFVISAVIAFFISNTLTSNITLLMKKIKAVENGDFSYKPVPKIKDETATLFYHFNSMSDKLNDLIERVAYEKTETQRAEYNALLAQTNPHFLFNALESINGLAKLRGQDEIVKIISSLSFLMRSIINGKDSMVTLKNEISYTDNYIAIQKVISGGRIGIEYDIDDQLLDIRVPKLIVQPIVENSVNYGLRDKNSDALIVISAYKEDDTLLINISDNGKGIGEEELQDIIERMNTQDRPENDSHAHIGLSGVNKRLKILYGDRFGLNISSTLGVGTVVRLTLPA